MPVSKKFVLTDDVKTTYLDHLERWGLFSQAAKHAGGTTARFLSLRKTDPEFNTSVDEALLLYKESIEAELHRRAVDGVEKGVYFQGVRTHTELQYSDTLLAMLVKKVNPDYNEKSKAEVVVSGGVLLTGAVAPSTEEWMRLNKKKPEELAAGTPEGDIIDVESVDAAIPVRSD